MCKSQYKCIFTQYVDGNNETWMKIEGKFLCIKVQMYKMTI